MAANGLILLCGILTGIMSARLLLPEGRGALAVVILWPSVIAGFGILSLQESVTYRISQANIDRASIICTAFYLSLSLSTCTVLIGYWVLPYLLGAGRLELLPTARLYLVLFIPSNFLSLTLLAVDHGDLRFKRYNFLRLLVPSVYLGGLVALWLFDAVSVEHVVWVSLAGSFAVAGLRLGLARRVIGLRFSWPEAYRLLRTGLSFHLTVVLIMLGTCVDKMIVATFWGDAVMGIYVVALTVASSGLSILTSSFHTVVFPSIGRRQGISGQRAYLAKALRSAMLFIAIGTVPLVVASPWMVPLLFGPEFSGAVQPAVILLLAYMPMALKQIIVRSLRGLSEARPGTIAEACTVTAFLLLAWPLTRLAGLNGIALALGVANVVSLAYLAHYLQRRLELRVEEWWGLSATTVGEIFRSARSVAGLRYLMLR